MNTLVLPITPKDGKLNIPKDFYSEMREWAEENDSMEREIVLRKPERTKTSKQLKYLFGVILPRIVNEYERKSGELFKKEIRKDIEYEFAYRMVEWLMPELVNTYDMFGEKNQTIKSISKFTKKEMTDLIDNIVSNVCKVHISEDPIEGHKIGLSLFLETPEDYFERVYNRDYNKDFR